MAETELFGVKELPPQRGDGGAQLRVWDRLIASAAVHLIADNWMLEPRKVDSDLMRATRLDLNVEQREPFVAAAHAIERERGSPAAHHGHARPVARVARERMLNPPLLRAHPSMRERHVRFEDLARAKLIGQMLVRLFGL